MLSPYQDYSRLQVWSPVRTLLPLPITVIVILVQHLWVGQCLEPLNTPSPGITVILVQYLWVRPVFWAPIKSPSPRITVIPRQSFWVRPVLTARYVPHSQNNSSTVPLGRASALSPVWPLPVSPCHISAYSRGARDFDQTEGPLCVPWSMAGMCLHSS